MREIDITTTVLCAVGTSSPWMPKDNTVSIQNSMAVVVRTYNTVASLAS